MNVVAAKRRKLCVEEERKLASWSWDLTLIGFSAMSQAIYQEQPVPEFEAAPYLARQNARIATYKVE